jgi:serine O-acetyltransferase
MELSNRDYSSRPLDEQLSWLLFKAHTADFVSLFFFRIGSGSDPFDRLLLMYARRAYKSVRSFAMKCPSVGPGLVIKHGVGTLIEAERIGKGCIIFHDVVVGFKNVLGEYPSLGDYVHISAGAKVLGRITIGDHSVIAANAVVTKDMPPNSLAVGIPAKILGGAGNLAEYETGGLKLI